MNASSIFLLAMCLLEIGSTSLRFGWSVFSIMQIEFIATASDDVVGSASSEASFWIADGFCASSSFWSKLVLLCFENPRSCEA